MYDTLKYHKSRPLQSNIDISGASLKHVMGGYSPMRERLQALEGKVSAVPETEALWFYVQQHAMSLVESSLHPEEPVGKYEPFIERYHSEIHWKTLRMFYYLLLICTRESRHAGGQSGKQKVYDMHPNIVAFHQNNVQDSSADSAVKAIIDNAPDVTLGEYTQFLVRMFTYPSYSGGYGGKAWKDIATPLNEFVQGNISAEILMDTAFTLAHNNGPIFNKGMLYNGYTDKLIKILDVQRSGQIPQLITSDNNSVKAFFTAELKHYVEAFSSIDGRFSGDVDWEQVKDIHGGVAWPSEVAAQSSGNTPMDWKKKLKSKAAKIKAKAAKLALLKGSYEIMPGVQIPKAKRSQK